MRPAALERMVDTVFLPSRIRELNPSGDRAPDQKFVANSTMKTLLSNGLCNWELIS